MLTLLTKFLLFFFFLGTTFGFYINTDQNKTDDEVVLRTKRALPTVGIRAVVITVGREIGRRVLVAAVDVASRVFTRFFPRVWRFFGGVAEKEVAIPLASIEEQSVAETEEVIEALEPNELPFNEIDELNDLGFNEIDGPNGVGNEIFEPNELPNELPKYNEVQGELDFFNDIAEGEAMPYNEEPNDDILIFNLS